MATDKTTVYADYAKDKVGWFFGVSGVRLAVVAGGILPVLWAVHTGAWTAAVSFAGIWLGVTLLTVVSVRGRSATGWLIASTRHAAGGLFGWTSFRSRAAGGRVADLAVPDLPGVLQGVQIHDGPPVGASLRRVAVIQDHATKTWAVTAAVVHPGIGMTDADGRRRGGEGLAGLIDLAGRTEKIDELLIVVRSVPDDGAERELWVARHRRPHAPVVSDRINADLAVGLTQASVRTEQFITFVVPETRLARAAKESGGGLEGRCRELYQLMGEIGAHLLGPMGMTRVSWLTSPELALACRTGFAPGDRAGVIDALAARAQDPGVTADVPWALAGPSGADPVVRHYSHDAWNSVSATIKLPDTGAVMGALAPILTPGEAGERRSFLAAFPVLSQTRADRQSGHAAWAADTAEALRTRLGVKIRARQRQDAARARSLDSKLARGRYLTRAYAVCTVTVPKTASVTEFGRRLDSAVRRAGFAPLRLDLAHDTGFAASTVPLGIGLTRRGDA